MRTISQIFILMVLSTAALVACNKKGGDSAPINTCAINQALPPGQFCNNGQIATATPCPANQMPPQGYVCNMGYLIPISSMNTYGTGNLLNAVQFQNSSMMGTVNLTGTGMMDPSDPWIAAKYYGTVAVSGTVQVMDQSLCGAPVGTYTIAGQGNMSMGWISNAMLTLTGPVQMQLMIGSAVLENPTDGVLDRNSMNNRLGIVSSGLYVGGNPCASITSY